MAVPLYISMLLSRAVFECGAGGCTQTLQIMDFSTHIKTKIDNHPGRVDPVPGGALISKGIICFFAFLFIVMRGNRKCVFFTFLETTRQLNQESDSVGIF